MALRSTTLIDDGRPVKVDALVEGGALRLPVGALEKTLGWKVQPQGLCRGEVCVPIRDRAALIRDEAIDLATLARLLDRPFVADAEAGIAVLGASAGDRAGRLAAMEAPDFTLPDLSGRLHSLRDQRGKKTLLIAWASW